jgi:hypothetical protein
MTPSSIASQLEYLARRLRHGCGNAGCQIKPPEGLHTNSACHCQPTKFASQFLGLWLECEEQGREWEKEAKP